MARRVREALDDATDLGAEIVMVEAPDVVEGIVRVAAARRVSRLVLPHRATSAIERMRRPTVAERVLERLPSIEIAIVGDARETTDAYRIGHGD